MPPSFLSKTYPNGVGDLFLDLLRADAVAAGKCKDAVEGRVTVTAGRIGLDRDLHGLPAAAEPAHRLRSVGSGGIRVQETPLAFDGLGCTLVALSRERSRD